MDVDKGLRDAAREIAKLKGQVETLKRVAAAAEHERDEVMARGNYLEIIEGVVATQKLKREKFSGESAAILSLGDWHFEENVDPKTVNGLNRYNPKIATQRANTVFQKTAELIDVACRKLTDVDELVIDLGGDFITGYIHEELVESNWLSPTEACLAVQDILMSGIDFLVKELKPKRTVISASYGNHGRTTQKMRFSTGHKNSYEWMMYRMVERNFRGRPKIEFRVADGYHNIIDVKGRSIRFHHGDAIKYKGGVGGPTIPIMSKIKAWNEGLRAPYMDVIHHLHQFLPHPKFLLNGSLIGTNAFTIRIAAPHQPPSQSLVLMSRHRGNIMTIPVFAE
jgi:hypothetical protein